MRRNPFDNDKRAEILIAVALAGSAVSAGAQIKAGADAKKQAKRQAALVLQQSGEEAKLRSEEGRRLQSRIQAQIGASGVRPAGSPLLFSLRSQGDTASEVSSILSAGASRAALLRKKGKDAFSAGIIGGIGTGLTGAVQAGALSFELSGQQSIFGFEVE